MSKIVILGNGYIGSKINKMFTEKFNINDVKHLYNYPYQNPAELKETLFQDIRQEFINTGTKWIVNCVGYTGSPNVDGCEDNKQLTWDLNVTLPTLLAQFCSDQNIKLINITSGCIYTDTNTPYEETDTPNFGIDSNDYGSQSSWYSKTKHALELCLNGFTNVYNLRIRMPICNDFNLSKNYLTKLLKYNNLLEEVNSKTVIEDLITVINKIITVEDIPTGTYNCVNPNPLTTKEVCGILDKYNLWNPHWKFINYEELQEHITAQRSNCILSTEKSRLYNIEFPTEADSLHRLLQEK